MPLQEPDFWQRDRINEPYVPKPHSAPVRARKLLTTLEEEDPELLEYLFGMRSMSKGIIVGDLRIDFAQKDVFKRGIPANLQPIQYATAEIFFLNVNTYIPSTKVAQLVWGSLSEKSENTIKVHIFRLREKIDEKINGEWQYIRSRTGFGYGLIDPSNRTS